jgi:DNA invertase Pin-like site-specific DNA recombinase
MRFESLGKAEGEPLCDTGSSQGRLLSTPLAAVAEFERELIREQHGEGRKRVMAAGVKFVRKPKLSEHQRAEGRDRATSSPTFHPSGGNTTQ